ncbi:MAG: hypothetical protein WAL90_14055 [Desulfobacterales bacterium]
MPISRREEPFWNQKKTDFFLWTIRRQSHIAAALQTQLIAAVAVMLLITLLLPIRLETALQGIFCGGMAVIALVWALIERRRSWLLSIKDPALKETAHQAMIAYLKQRATGDRLPDKGGKENCFNFHC